ncbi:hypothetical protein MKQ68_00095 [Chitinophaga horti]|uniref:Uncharacterized protein n=1 Tax=Chitinophaga horti TaxID=2920382 RepID=A0ABY6J1D5_9BACT|nr:hypothetical protein [Chitinophaga horti]UYQ93499.1 hypothetical protein MKQ68_00095 [Chitinophaga horti]
MKWFASLLIIALFASCAKEDVSSESTKNRWIETSLRRDTITFPFALPEKGTQDGAPLVLKLRSYREIQDSRQFNNDYVVMLSADSIRLNTVIETDRFGNWFYFKMNEQRTKFQISNFYGRAELPAILEFERY